MICPSSSVAFSQGFGKGVAEGVHVRTSSSVGVLGWTGDERDPLDHVKIHHNRCSMLLGSVPSIRKIFIAAMEAGFGPSEPCEKRWDVKISQSNYGEFRSVQLVLARWWSLSGHWDGSIMLTADSCQRHGEMRDETFRRPYNTGRTTGASIPQPMLVFYIGE